MARSLTGPGNIAKLGDTMIGAFNEAQAPDVPSASTVNLIITKGNLVDITGTATILSISLAPGAERVLRFTGSLRLTNSANLVLPGGEDIITTPNDMAIVRGYANNVVRFVTYSRASGYVQRVGDKLSGTLTFAPGDAISPPIKYQAGVLTTLKVPHAFEWDGSKAYMTTGASVRKELLYVDGDASKLTGLASKQVTDALGYTPFDPNSSPNRISPNGGLLEAGQIIDMHYGGSSNDFDARIEVGSPSGGSGSSWMWISAGQLNVGGSKVWTQSNLTNLNQLSNGPGYAPSASPVFTGQITAPQGSRSNPGIIFGGELAADTGFYGPGDGSIGISCNNVDVATINYSGIKYAITKGINFTKNGGTLNGDLRIDFNGNTVRFYDTGQDNRGAYLDVMACATNMGSQIVTTSMIPDNIGSGYQKLPSGLILQWGRRINGGVNALWVTFPIAFPNNVLNVQTSYEETTGRGSYAAASGATTTGVYVATDNCSTWWFAIGY